MSSSNVWTRSRARMRLIPELLAQCSGEYCLIYIYIYIYDAAAYGKCVASTNTGKQELTKNMCVKEFEVLKICFQSAAKKGVK
uniref:NADH:ubiquinone oxidoreductase complex assembly factor 8 n=1 Tax=Sinocyclocheilus anshuiensis TaxID=1608454 RepID=A0A671PVM1_9TELE